MTRNWLHCPRGRRCAAVLLLAGLLLSSGVRSAAAQETRGYDQIIKVYATGEERNRQRDLWVFEVHLKPMRMRWVDITNPETGEKSRELVWYLAFKAINRPIAVQQDETDTEPVNTLDPILQPPTFLPEFTLVTYDDPATEIPNKTYMDQVIPEAVIEINKVEAHRVDDVVLSDTVSIIQPVPAPTPEDATDGEWIYGVATWRSVDPETDYFKVILSGFSNGYENQPGPGGEPIKWRKVAVQKFTRRGDRFDPTQVEFKFDGPARWTYQPADGSTAEPVVQPLEPEAGT